jgi:hypothetical protein
MTGNVEEAILQMYLSGISTRKIAGVTDPLRDTGRVRDVLRAKRYGRRPVVSERSRQVGLSSSP